MPPDADDALRLALLTPMMIISPPADHADADLFSLMASYLRRPSMRADLAASDYRDFGDAEIVLPAAERRADDDAA